MRDILVCAIVFGALPFILFRPWLGILVWSWLGFMNPHRLTWGFAYDFPFAQLVALTMFAGLVFSSERKRVPITTETIGLLLFVAWMGVTTFFALRPEDASEQWSKVWKIQLFTVLTMMLMRDKKRLHALIWVIVLSIGYFSVKGGVFTLVTGGQYLVWGPTGSFYEGNNEAGLAFILLIPLIRYLHLNAERRWVRMGLLGAMSLTAVAILGTSSRGAFLGVMAMALMLVWKSRRRVLMLGLTAVGVVFTLSFMPAEWFQRMDTIRTYEKDESAQNRINAWWFAFNLAKARPIGGGFETFHPDLFVLYAPVPGDSHDAHSIYFEIMGEHGFFGLFLFLLLGALTWRGCTWIYKKARDDPETSYLADLAKMVQVSLLGYAVTGAFLGMAYFDLYYNLIAIVVIGKALVREHLALAASRRFETVDLREPLATTEVAAAVS